MKFTFPSAKYFLKSVIIAFVLGFIAYLLAPVLKIENLDIDQIFSYGVLAGALIGGLFAGTQVMLASSAKVESIFIGNLAFKASSGAVRELFEQYGDVHAVRLMTDRVTRKPRGFGFVEMRRKDALNAIRALNGQEFQGRELKVNIANERKAREEQEAEQAS